MQLEYHKEEEKVLCALEEAQSCAEGKPNIQAIARKHGVDPQRLRRRYQGVDSKSSRPPSNRKLSVEQEDALLAWVRTLDQMQLAACPELI